MRAMLSILAAIFAVAAALPAVAQSACSDRAALAEALAQIYGEAPQARGLTGTGNMIELFASAESGTWTILLTQPGGQTCAVFSGEAFSRIGDGQTVLPKGEPM